MHMMISVNYQFNALHVCGVCLCILGWGYLFMHRKEEHHHPSSRLSNPTLSPTLRAPVYRWLPSGEKSRCVIPPWWRWGKRANNDPSSHEYRPTVREYEPQAYTGWDGLNAMHEIIPFWPCFFTETQTDIECDRVQRTRKERKKQKKKKRGWRKERGKK